jgi:fumarate hydratase class II
MIHGLLESIEILASVCREFTDRCVVGIEANGARCRRNAESTAALATALAPEIGYDRAAKVAKKSLAEDRTLRDIVLEEGLLGEEELDRILDFRAMTEPGIP